MLITIRRSDGWYVARDKDGYVRAVDGPYRWRWLARLACRYARFAEFLFQGGS